MFPARKAPLPEVLESNSGPLDPLDPAMEACVSAKHAVAWRVEAVLDVPATDTHCAGTLTIYVAGGKYGELLAGILLCFDRGSYRECKRLRPDGTALCVISGQRVGPVMRTEHASSNPRVVNHALAATNNFLNSKDGGAS
jgi:hypothetical protein